MPSAAASCSSSTESGEPSHAIWLDMSDEKVASDVRGAPFASASRHFTGKVRPAVPAFTAGRLSTGGRKPEVPNRTW